MVGYRKKPVDMHALLPLSHISIVDNKVSAEHADLMVMTHLNNRKSYDWTRIY